VGENLKGRMLVWDGLDMEFFTCAIVKNPECPVCGG